MPIPDFQTAMLPVLRAFAEGAESVNDVLPVLRRLFAITDEEAAQMIPSGRLTLLQSRAHWARTYLSKAGLLQSPKRNRHVITEAGHRVLASPPARIDMRYLEQFAPYREWKEQTGEIAVQGDGVAPLLPPADVAAQRLTPVERLEAAFSEIQSALAADLLLAVLEGTPKQFEQLIVDLLLRMGYGRGDPRMGERLGRTGDGGLDGVIYEDALGLDAVYIQAKRYARENTVGRPALQAFVGSLTGEAATKGVFVTTSDFTREARDYLNRVQHRIVLINGPRLTELMIRHQVGVRERTSYVLSSLDEDYFADPEKL